MMNLCSSLQFHIKLFGHQFCFVSPGLFSFGGLKDVSKSDGICCSCGKYMCIRSDEKTELFWPQFRGLLSVPHGREDGYIRPNLDSPVKQHRCLARHFWLKRRSLDCSHLGLCRNSNQGVDSEILAYLLILDQKKYYYFFPAENF